MGTYRTAQLARIAGVHPNTVRLSAAGCYDEALVLAQGYLDGIEAERRNAEEAVCIAQGILARPSEAARPPLRRAKAAQELGLTVEILRNWERNGLVSSMCGEGGCRVYAPQELRTLKVIRALRCAGYSLEAILRMLQQLSCDPGASMRDALDIPREDDDIVTVCDRLISSLEQAQRNACTVVGMLRGLRADYGSTGALSHEPTSSGRKGEGLPA